MKQILKKLNKVIVLFFETLTSIIDVLLLGHPFSGKLKIDKRGGNVSVLANGPSAKDVIQNKSELLTSSDLVMMNDAAIYDSFDNLKPQYYFLLDPAYFGGVLKGNANFYKVVEKLYEKLEQVTWPLILFLPSDKKANNISKRFRNHGYIKVLRYNATRIEGFDFFQMWAYRHGLGVPSSRNILIPILLNLLNLGYETVYLYGAEFSWTKTIDVDEDNGRIFINDRHYYNKDEIRYLEKGSYRIWLRSISEMLYGIEQVGKYANLKNTRIINRTRGSFIDTFPFENPFVI